MNKPSYMAEPIGSPKFSYNQSPDLSKRLSVSNLSRRYEKPRFRFKPITNSRNADFYQQLSTQSHNYL